MSAELSEGASVREEGPPTIQNGVDGSSDGALPKIPHQPNVVRLFGDIMWVLSQSPQHKHLFLNDMEWLVVRPLMLKQVRIFHDKRQPIAFALWAEVSEEVEKELCEGRTRLKPGEWKSGDRLWLFELVAPSLTGKPGAVDKLMSELSSTAFGGKPFKFRKLDQKTGKLMILEASAKQPASS